MNEREPDIGFRNLFIGTMVFIMFVCILFILSVIFPNALDVVETVKDVSGKIVTTKTTKTSFISSILTVIGVISVFAAALYYRKQAKQQERQADALIKQANAMQDQAKLANEQFDVLEKRRIEEDFNNVLKALNPKTSENIVEVYAALETIKTITSAFPNKYFFNTISFLIQYGKDLSENKLSYLSQSERDFEFNDDTFNHHMKYSNLIFQILKAITDIIKAEAVIEFIKNNEMPAAGFQIIGFSIPQPHTRNGDSFKPHMIFDTDFDHFRFVNCDLKGVHFITCNFSKTLFDDTRNMHFDHCLIDPYQHPNINKTTRERRSIRFTFEFCYYWHQGEALQTRLNDIPERKLLALDRKKFDTVNGSPIYPLVPNVNWDEWKYV